MRRFHHRGKNKTKTLIGITLAVVGGLIVISFIPIEFILVLIGLGLLAVGGLILKMK